MSFTNATVYAPIVLISLLYLPTLFYTIVVGIKFYGGRKWIFETFNNPVYFIFPILTNMSFYGKPKNDIKKEEGNNASIDIIEEDRIDTGEEEGNEASEKDMINMHFSIEQSNILYMLFLLGSVLCLFGDVYHQDQRGIFWLRQELKMSQKYNSYSR